MHLHSTEVVQDVDNGNSLRYLILSNTADIYIQQTWYKIVPMATHYATLFYNQCICIQQKYMVQDVANGNSQRYLILTIQLVSTFNRSGTRCCQWQHTTLYYLKQYICIQQKWFKMLPKAIARASTLVLSKTWWPDESDPEKEMQYRCKHLFHNDNMNWCGWQSFWQIKWLNKTLRQRHKLNKIKYFFMYIYYNRPFYSCMLSDLASE